MYCYDALIGSNPDTIILEIGNIEAFIPLVEALFPKNSTGLIDMVLYTI
jgi:hypothetical protein